MSAIKRHLEKVADQLEPITSSEGFATVIAALAFMQDDQELSEILWKCAEAYDRADRVCTAAIHGGPCCTCGIRDRSDV